MGGSNDSGFLSAAEGRRSSLSAGRKAAHPEAGEEGMANSSLHGMPSGLCKAELRRRGLLDVEEHFTSAAVLH